MEESKSINRLKNKLIKELPFFPNEKKTLEELESKNINEVVIHYLHWQTRQVPARIRTVHRAPELTSDKRYKTLKEDINSLLDKVRNGESLHPFLSHRAHQKGYTPVQRVKDGEVDGWEDKDQILNTKGFHHFHLDMTLEQSGLSKRTNEVLFAFVDRKSFHAIAIFDHSVFEQSDASGSMTDERKRMWDVHEKYATLGMKPGSVYMNNPIMTSGHPLYLIRLADHYTRRILEIDPRLGEREFVNSIYKEANLEPPSKFNLDWHLEGLDLGILDKKNNVFFSVKQGHL
ncbi:hypothetical protein SAMN03080615_00551 [Amphritea atlantica]|uniref:Uncharacterized protein n=1 Tax=Amphritea atlantica TaxID=355243 RepID=A0A1H9DJB5_9GAMM|nr:hypothetical protein [Amphritea atlantica]SEQ12818.1 hypothetical protein SAMN03080615_00551 [Amphritea atlantica]